jgi:hypothetical protein
MQKGLKMKLSVAPLSWQFRNNAVSWRQWKHDDLVTRGFGKSVNEIKPLIPTQAG